MALILTKPLTVYWGVFPHRIYLTNQRLYFFFFLNSRQIQAFCIFLSLFDRQTVWDLCKTKLTENTSPQILTLIQQLSAAHILNRTRLCFSLYIFILQNRTLPDHKLSATHRTRAGLLDSCENVCRCRISWAECNRAKLMLSVIGYISFSSAWENWCRACEKCQLRESHTQRVRVGSSVITVLVPRPSLNADEWQQRAAEQQ